MNSKLFVTKEHIAAIMAALSYEFCIIPNTTTTICAAVHPNGFKLATGESACVCPENFNKELGEKYAKEDAVKKAESELWKLEGYRLKHKLTEPIFAHYIEAVNEKVNDFLNFGDAIAALKSGYKVARAGWNGKNMWLSYLDPYMNKQFTLIEKDDAEGTFSPYIGMKTADNKYVPWLASQTDLLSCDWVIITDE